MSDSPTQPGWKPPTIDAGLPETQDKWPPDALRALRQFVQGDVVADPPFFYFADPARPVWLRTHAYTADSAGPEVIEVPDQARPRYGLITTQTCDIGEEDADRPVRPWIQLSPVYDLTLELNSGLRRLLRDGAGPQYLMHVPDLPNGFWVVDFRIEVPVEKGWLAPRARLRGFADEAAQRRVGERIAMLRSRPAFAGSFVELLQRPLVTALKRLRQEHRELYGRMNDQVDEVAVELDSHLDPHNVRVTLIVDGTLDEDVHDWWRNWWDESSARCHEAEMELQAFAVRTASQITLSEYRRMTTVPLARISPQT